MKRALGNLERLRYGDVRTIRRMGALLDHTGVAAALLTSHVASSLGTPPE